MFLQHLHLRHFRNYGEQTVTFAAPKTILLGDNAQGKSNLLEAVELLSTLRSHRVSRDRELVQEGWDTGHITGFLQRDPTTFKLGLTLRSSGRRTALLNTETLRRQLDLLGTLNTVRFSALDLDLVRGGPAQRRDWIDGLLTQLEPLSAHLLQQYGRILRQRNALLRQMAKGNPRDLLGRDGGTPEGTVRDGGRGYGAGMGRDLGQDLGRDLGRDLGQDLGDEGDDRSEEGTEPSFLLDEEEGELGLGGAKMGISQLAVWDAQLATLGTRVMRRRVRALGRLGPLAQEWHQRISGQREELGIRYVPNVAPDAPDQWDNPDYVQGAFLTQIRQRALAEQYQGVSLVGPHRDEVELLINETPARHYGSQGQQRTLVLALKLAELHLLEEVIREPPVLLLDDVLAELDLRRQNQLLETIDDRFQTLITTTHLGAFDAQWLQRSQIFQVHRGLVMPQ